MARPEYLVSFMPYSDKIVNGIYRVTGDTEKYWKCLRNSTGDTFLVRKSNLMERGLDIQYHSWTKAQVIEYRRHDKLVRAIRNVNLLSLSTKQLEDIAKIIAGGKNDEISSTD